MQHSRKDTIAAQPKVTRWQEATMAPVRKAVVCRMHNIDHWQLAEGWDKYVHVHEEQPTVPSI